MLVLLIDTYSELILSASFIILGLSYSVFLNKTDVIFCFYE